MGSCRLIDSCPVCHTHFPTHCVSHQQYGASLLQGTSSHVQANCGVLRRCCLSQLSPSPPPPSGPVRLCQPSPMQAGSRSYRIVPVSGGLGLLSALSVGCVLVYMLVTLTYPPPCSTRTCDVMYCVANNIDAANVQHACLPLLYLQGELRNAAMRLVSCTTFVKQVQHTCEFVYNPT